MMAGSATLTIVAASIVPIAPTTSTAIRIQRRSSPWLADNPASAVDVSIVAVIGVNLQRSHGAGAQLAACSIEHDAHGNALRDLGEDTCRIGVGDQRELRRRG